MITIKKHHKVRDHCYYTGKFRGAPHSIFNLRYKTPKEIPIAFYNNSTRDNHFIIKELLKIFEGQFEKKQRNILLFQYQLKKILIIVKQLDTNHNDTNVYFVIKKRSLSI